MDGLTTEFQQFRMEMKRQYHRGCVAAPDILRILLIRNDGIGDLLNATPAIRWLRQSYPEASITCLVNPLAAPLLRENPDVDRVWTQPPNGAFRRWRLLRQIRRERFDLVVALQTSAWCHFLTVASGTPRRVGRYQNRFRWGFTHADRSRDPKGQTREIERNLRLISPFCIGEPSDEPLFFLTETERRQATEHLAQIGLVPSQRWAAIHPGGSSEDKLWPATSYAFLAERLRRLGLAVVVLHGPGESALAEIVARHATQEVKREDADAISLPPTLTLAPTSLRELAAILSHALLFICNDSGPMHIAAALRVPTVALFGPTDHLRWGPRHAHIVRQEMDCWPCSAHHCRIGYRCIKTLPVEQVWEHIHCYRCAWFAKN